MHDLEGAPIPRPEGVKPMTISSNPLRSTKKFAKIGVIFKSAEQLDISITCSAGSGQLRVIAVAGSGAPLDDQDDAMGRAFGETSFASTSR